MFNEIENTDYVPVACLRDDKLFTLSSSELCSMKVLNILKWL